MGKKKGFLESLLDDITMKRIVDSTKDSSGKPDKFKASMIAHHLGYDSSEEIMRLGAILCREGAFDDSPQFCPPPHRKDTSWRNRCEDGSILGVFPQDFSSEEDYEEALKEAKYGWREECEDGSEYGIDPDDFEDQDDYEEALEATRSDCHSDLTEEADPDDCDNQDEFWSAYEASFYAWRNDCLEGQEYGIDPKDYATKEDYCEAVSEAKYSWRENCYEAEDYGINLQDYETEAEYRTALDEAIRLDRNMETLPSTRNEYLRTMHARAAYKLANIERCPPPDFYYSQDNDEIIAERCRFVLKNPNLTAARYLVINDDCAFFLYSLAISDHFGIFPQRTKKIVLKSTIIPALSWK